MAPTPCRRACRTYSSSLIASVLTLTVISARNPLVQSVPGGLGYVTEMFDEARLRDGLSHQQLPDAWLAQCLSRLRRQYRKRLRLRWVDPHSVSGLFLAVRFRIRKFPAIIIDKELVYNGDVPEELEALIAERLAPSAD